MSLLDKFEPKHKVTAFHILGVAHAIADGNYPTCPFTSKSSFFSKALIEAGYKVFYYGVEGGDIVCTKFIPIVSKKTFFETYPTPEDTTKNNFGDTEGKAWEEYFKNGVKAVKENIVDPKRDIILPFFGYPQKDITDPSGLITVEPGIGHPGSYANFRIFESYAYQNICYGKEGKDEHSDKWPHSYDHVIPNFYFPELYPFSAKKEDYIMFMGRLNWGKGLSLAVEIANYFNIRLVVAGAGDLKTAVPDSISLDNIDFKGVLKFEEKLEYVKKAKAFLAPSQYMEPFGHVVPEASLCGTPVLTTDYGAFSETVLQGKTGFRCKVFRDFIRAIENIDTIDPYYCRYSAIQRYSMHKLLPKYIKYFDDILTLNLDEQGWYTVN
jgi:glycosyltransferase involved in cell wall biosynthesis